MIYSSHFYYQEAQTKVSYTRTPTGNFEVNRMMNGRPAWVLPALPREQKQRNLVLADWSTPNWSEDKRRRVQEELTKLIQQGFSVSVWKSGQLVPLTLETLATSLQKDNIDGIGPVAPEDIYKVAAKQKMAKDQIHILDDHWIDCLCRENCSIQRTISVSNLLAIKSEEDRKKIIEMIRRANPPVKAILHDEFSATANKYLHDLKNQFPELPVEVNYATLKYDPSYVNGYHDKLFWGSFFDDRTKPIVLDGGSLNLEQYKHLKNLDISGEHVITDELASLLNASASLQTINASKCLDLIHDFSFPLANLPQLEYIDLSGSYISYQNIVALLKAAPMLKRINLSSFVQGGPPAAAADLLLDKNCLRNLEFVNLDNAKLELIVTLVSAAPNMKQLSLQGAKLDNSSYILPLPKDSLQSLDTINLSRSKLQWQLKAFQSAAPHLKKIDCSQCHFKQDRKPGEEPGGPSDLIAGGWADLEEINLNASSIYAPGLKHFFMAAPNLKKVNLDACIIMGEALDLAEGSLPYLEVIELGESLTMTPANLRILLAAAPNLKNRAELEEKLPALELAEQERLERERIERERPEKERLERQRAIEERQRAEIELAQQQRAKEIAEDNTMPLPGMGQGEGNKPAAAPQIPRPRSESISLDANTRPEKDKQFDLAQMFWSVDGVSADPEIALYRLDAYQQIEVNKVACNIQNAFLLDNKGLDIQLTPANINRSNDDLASRRGQPGGVDHLYYGKKSIQLTEKWQALPSISAREKMTDYHVSDNAEVDIQYSKRDNLYYVRSKPGAHIPQQPVSIDFLLDVKDSPKNTSGLPANVQQLIKSCHDFGEAALNLPEGPLTGQDYLNALITQQVGACRHRSLVFKAEMLRLHPEIPVRIINNDCHSFVEILHNKQWIICNLGGYPAELNIDKSNDPLAGAERLQEQVIEEATLNPNGVISEVETEAVHNHKDMKNFKPSDKPFEYTGAHKHKNQGMIIEQLSQYLTITGQHSAAIPKVQDGVCDALSHFFKDEERTSWDKAVDEVSKWNGEEETLTPALRAWFDKLYTYVAKYQLSHTNIARQFLGDNLELLIQKLEINDSVILSNPWHAIIARKTGEDQYELYDPNNMNIKLVNGAQLLKGVFNSLGELIEVEGSRGVQPAIKDHNNFLEKGGLLSLCQCTNTDALLQQIMNQGAFTAFSPQALDGILLRTTAGMPAWQVGMNHPNQDVKQLTLNLLAQFKAAHPEHGDELLQQSIADIPAIQKHELITQIVQTNEPQAEPLLKPSIQEPEEVIPKKPTELKKDLVKLVRTSNKDLYEQQFKTWDHGKESTISVPKYCQEVVGAVDERGDEIKKRLIEFDSTTELDHIADALQKHCKATSRPCFYVDKPEDLVCSAAFVSRGDDNVGTITGGPGGALYDFLQLHKDSKVRPIIVVNYEQFHADDIVRFNGLLDVGANADGTALPADAVVVGLTNLSNPDCYQGADLYSRFDVKEKCPVSHKLLEHSTLTPIAEALAGPKTIINLYHSPDWESRLLGRWIMDGAHLRFQEGELQQAIQSGLPIEIQNGLWGDKTFDRFFEHLRTNGVRYAGQTFTIPTGTPVIRQDGYDWETLATPLSTVSTIANLDNAVHPVLNASGLTQFFSRYDYNDNDKTISHQLGLIEAARGQTLSVHVTSLLTDDGWAMLLSECARCNVRLQAYCAPGVKLPEGLAINVAPPGAVKPFKLDPVMEAAPLNIVSSSDIDTTVAMLTKGENDWLVIDVSECQAQDLLLRLDGKLNQDTLAFEFNQTNSALLTALNSHQKIILKGHFSPALVDALAQTLIDRISGAEQPTRLEIVTDDAVPFAFMSDNLSQHEVTSAEKLACLPDIAERIEPALLEQESLSQLRARALYMQLHPNEINSTDAWKGMRDIPGGIQLSKDPLNVKQSVARAKAFTDQRKDAVTQVLNESPCVFLTGLSGVGKTTFVHNELCAPDSGYQLFAGEGKIKEWAESHPEADGKVHVLFLDEANLSQREWSEFEGLFQNPPGILVDGTFHRLGPNHKVVFAGNPISYGDERKLAPFFQRHGGAVLFEPLSKDVIYEKILKPIFVDQNIDEATVQAISEKILEVYAFICERSKTEVLISPRELQMMALMTLSNYRNDPKNDIIYHLENTVYELGRALVPADQPAELVKFDEQFKPIREQRINPVKMLDNDFLITSSRERIVEQLQERLQLREWRTEHEGINEDQKYGGLGGLILEGEPGIGKSELVVRALVTAGYQEVGTEELTKPTQHLKPFYRMPVSMALAEKQALLIKAFNEGAVVIIDEINSSPMMEQFLNALLMGKNPEDGSRPTKPGFMVIGTQNPITMAGRRAASTALQRRMTTIVLPEYTQEEMLAILTKRGVEPIEAVAIVDAYLKQREHAIRNNLTPVACFRDLLKVGARPQQPRFEEVLVAPDEVIEIPYDVRPGPVKQPEPVIDFVKEDSEDLKDNRPKIPEPIIDSGQPSPFVDPTDSSNLDDSLDTHDMSDLRKEDVSSEPLTPDSTTDFEHPSPFGDPSNSSNLDDLFDMSDLRKEDVSSEPLTPYSTTDFEQPSPFVDPSDSSNLDDPFDTSDLREEDVRYELETPDSRIDFGQQSPFDDSSRSSTPFAPIEFDDEVIHSVDDSESVQIGQQINPVEPAIDSGAPSPFDDNVHSSTPLIITPDPVDIELDDEAIHSVDDSEPVQIEQQINPVAKTVEEPLQHYFNNPKLIRKNQGSMASSSNPDAVSLAPGKPVPVMFQRVPLEKGDVIREVADFSLANGGASDPTRIGILEQDHRGTVTDTTPMSSNNLTDEDKSILALKQAEMLLKTYRVGAGDIVIQGSADTADQARRLYAALLYLKEDNPAFNGINIKTKVQGGGFEVGSFQRENTVRKKFTEEHFLKHAKHLPLVADVKKQVTAAINNKIDSTVGYKKDLATLKANHSNAPNEGEDIALGETRRQPKH